MENSALKLRLFLKVIGEIAALLTAVAGLIAVLTPLMAELRHWIF
jgi:hypothetical protein